LTVPVRSESERSAPTGDSTADSVDETAGDSKASPGTVEPAAESRRSELVTVAEYLLASGQPTDARELLMAAGRDGGLEADAEDLLVELSLDSARVDAEAGQFSGAVAGLAETASVLSPGPARARLDVRRARIEVLQRLSRADDFEARGVLSEAHRAVLEALSIDPDYVPAVEREQRLREALVADYHERALRAWRARDIDLAIRTWRELLDHAPEFEPARVYLERAEELRQRLDEDGGG
jgi:tetratricopeptide (TPR) repeat protein